MLFLRILVTTMTRCEPLDIMRIGVREMVFGGREFRGTLKISDTFSNLPLPPFLGVSHQIKGVDYAIRLKSYNPLLRMVARIF
jgi:hypothetical protein